MDRAYIEVGGIYFNIPAIKKMGKKKFSETYKGKLRGVDLEDAWYKVTGFKKKASK